MTDSSFKTQSISTGDTLVDVEAVTTGAGTVDRQRVRIGGAAGTDLATVFSTGSLQTGVDNEVQSGQNITTDSGVGANTAAGLANATYPAGSVVYFQSVEDHSSIQIQISGTWTGTLQTERTIDGVTWFPTNVRRNAAGNQITNQLTQSGLYVGTYATTFKYRVRAISAITGTATVSFSAGTFGGTFLLSEVTVISEAQYYTSSAGGNTMWGADSSDAVLPGNNSTETVLFALKNTASTGGRVIYIKRISVGADLQCKIRRYRSPTLSVASGGTAVSPSNRAGVSTVTSVASALTCGPANGTPIVITGGIPTDEEKTVFIGSAGGQDTSDEDGTIIIPPGQTIIWTAVPKANNTTCFVEVVYWDGNTLP